MRVVVLGAGAVGSLLGAKLARAGHEVLLVGRPDHVGAIRARGLEVRGLTRGRFHLPAAVRLAPATEAEAVLLTVKAVDVGRAARLLARRLAHPTPVLALQNGLGIEERVVASLRAGGWRAPQRWVVRGLNSMGATFLGPGRIVHAGAGPIVLPGGARGISARSRARLERLLDEAGVPHRRAADFEREVWRKLLVNASINPVTALHGVPNGALRRPQLEREARELRREAQRVAAAVGYAFTDAEADRDFLTVVRATARNRSSMLQDIDRGRRTEIRAISGAIAGLARRRRVPVPATRRVLGRVLERVRRDRTARGRRGRRRPT